MAPSITIPPEWTECPECGGLCLCCSRTLVSRGGRIAMQIGLKCRMCRKSRTIIDSELVTI